MRRFLHAMHAYGILISTGTDSYGLAALGYAHRPDDGAMWAALGATTSLLWQ
ncbi:hypothetical protein ABZ897_55410 [Nonomuraea sp. NPDC046802]|uniref:hypothetical protein n=1 Tax=Nonomuraea sp. NPDC046802 TaxID=3154919 RepID=UPI0033E09AE7